jgi:nitroreductase
VRAFAAVAVPDGDVREIVGSGQCAATSSNLQAATVIQVKDPSIRARLAQVAGGQAYVETAGAFLVFCADLHRARLACEAQGGAFREDLTEHFLLATVDAALLAQNCVVAAESMGYGICYIGALRNDPRTVCELLALPRMAYPLFGLCLGRPAQDPGRKPRLPLEAVLGVDGYPEAAREPAVAAYDEVLRAYYRDRSGGTKDSSWSQEMKAVLGREARPHMKAFLAERGFGLL